MAQAGYVSVRAFFKNGSDHRKTCDRPHDHPSKKQPMANELVLVTGGSGFIGTHCILQLLEAGYRVRTTVRSLKREADVRAMLQSGGAAEPGNRLAFFVADLEDDAGWPDAVAGCDYVLHVASPLPPSTPKHEDELIIPAREGTLRVLRAASDAGVRRVVLTSSFSAIGYGHPPQSAPFTEKDWSNLDGDVAAYPKSKTLAERAAWDFIAREGRALELSVINPVGVLGPVLGPDYSASILLVQRLMAGAMPGCPRLNFGLVDVRDVADLHLRAMTHPAAKGERFIAAAGDFFWMRDIATVLKLRMGAAAKRVPTRELPNWLVRLAALRDPAIRLITPELGKPKNATSAKARRILGWTPRSSEDAIVATAQSLVQLKLLKQS
jgi:nucleoside-diphosphate-sugar epimerase